jgi:hypothetical protein
MTSSPARFVGGVPADKGFIDALRQTLLAEPPGVMVITPPRKGMATAALLWGRGSGK